MAAASAQMPPGLIRPMELPEQRLLALHDRMRVLKQGLLQSALYQRDFRRFLLDWVWTQDEERGGQVARLPDDPYLGDVCDALIERILLLAEKSRRVRGSWIACGFDLWVAAGGQDPRWPSLMLSTHNRQVVLAARKLKDFQGSAWFLRERIRFIYDQAIRRGIHEVWPEFPEFEFTYSEARGSNGARINAVPSGSDQLRGPGATLIHGEEVAFWPAAKAAIAGALPCIQNGGHIILITTPQAGTHAEQIRNGTLKKRAV